MSNLVLRESTLDEIKIFYPKIFYIIDPVEGIFEPVKQLEGELYIWNSSTSSWVKISNSYENKWLMRSRVFIYLGEDND